MLPLIHLLAAAGLAGSHPPDLGPAPPAAVPIGVPQVGTPPALYVTPTGLPCPGPTVHPFQRLPRICVATACACAGDPNGSQVPPPAVIWVKEFEQAAHIPLPRFSAEGCPVAADGLLIYEGMRLVVYFDGSYELSFTATVPEMPVTLRLQLVFANHDGDPNGRRLTLPPIRLAPNRDARPGDVDGTTFHVAHRGYSGLFQWGRVTKDNPHLYRVGTARFGTPVALEDPNR